MLIASLRSFPHPFLFRLAGRKVATDKFHKVGLGPSPLGGPERSAPVATMSDEIVPFSPAAQRPLPSQNESLVQRYPVAAYFALTFAVSWTGALRVAAPHLLNGEPLPKLAGILMFPAMLLGPSSVGIVLTRFLDGSAGMRDLFFSMGRVRFRPRWYAVLLIPPAMTLAILLSLKALVSPVFAPNHFLIGLAFGIPAGFLEEIGWMGFAFPKMRQKIPGFSAAVLLGLCGASGTCLSSIFWGLRPLTGPTGFRFSPPSLPP
jgi:membrane protease YdiL (CAAX protease family)